MNICARVDQQFGAIVVAAERGHHERSPFVGWGLELEVDVGVDQHLQLNGVALDGGRVRGAPTIGLQCAGRAQSVRSNP